MYCRHSLLIFLIGFQAVAAIIAQITVVLFMTTCSVGSYRPFRQVCYINLHCE